MSDTVTDPLGAEVEEPVQGEGQLGGFNPGDGDSDPLAGEPDPVEAVPADAVIPPEGLPEPEAPSPAPEQLAPSPEPDAEAEAPAPAKVEEETGTPVKRTYLIFEATANDGVFRQRLGVEAKNAETAIRLAYKGIVDETGEYPEKTLVAVAERMWRPTSVKARPSDAVTIEIG